MKHKARQRISLKFLCRDSNLRFIVAYCLVKDKDGTNVTNLSLHMQPKTLKVYFLLKKAAEVWQIRIKAVPLHSQTRNDIAEWSSW